MLTKVHTQLNLELRTFHVIIIILSNVNKSPCSVELRTKNLPSNIELRFLLLSVYSGKTVYIEVIRAIHQVF